MRTKRLVCTEQGRVELLEMDVPAPQEGEVLVRTLRTLICVGTERAFMLGLENTPLRYPDYYWGYSNVGEVIEVGPGVEGFAAGDLVAGDGFHAGHAIISRERLAHVPDGLDPEAAVFFHLGTIALQGVRKPRIELGERVAVMGQGTIGNLAMQQAKLCGGMPVVAVDLDDRRLQVALECGADETVNPREVDLLTAAPPQVVIEATGSPEAIVSAFQWTQRMGRVVLLASTRGNPEINFYRDVHKKGLIIHGASNGSRQREESAPVYWTWLDDCQVVLALLAAGKLVVEPLVSHRVTPEESLDIYEAMRTDPQSMLAPIIVWD